MLAKPFVVKMGDLKQLDVESQMETTPLHPRDDVHGNKRSQADLDR